MIRRSRGYYLVLAVQLGWALGADGLVRAQAGDPPGYREAVEAAQREFGAANFGEARDQFARADRLSSNARTQLGLGRSEFELRNYAGAIEHFKSALASRVQPLDAGTRPLAEQYLKLAERSVGRFRIESNATELNVSIDGDPVALSSDRTLVLNLGSRLLEVGASDHESQRLQLNVKGGEDRKLSFALEPTPPWYENPWVWVGAGALLAGATIAIVAFATSEPRGDNLSTTPGRVRP